VIIRRRRNLLLLLLRRRRREKKKLRNTLCFYSLNVYRFSWFKLRGPWLKTQPTQQLF